ncbi:hypothetical protein CFI00_11370 [Nocardioides sp. S5]|uniref:hypothetical protein n=1 Tax=Nocardioides sp. S5 TaxID=2017486 RepID=UPI001A8F3DE0|nr:hypothetical protein [Nocardioides sp. S5]QSR31086.1 hypothetical protein CFI00_11370 [Nocardioides sp. S5]
MREFLTRAQAAVDPTTTGGDGGRLPLGPMADWEVFPFEREGLRPRPLVDYADPEPDRRKAPEDCKTCTALGRDDLVLHMGERLAVIRPGGTSLPFVANVVSRTHEVLDELDDDGHVELGRLLGRTYAALRALEGVGSVHINKWENGAGHLSVTLLARPLGVLQLRGSNLPVWADMLPPTPLEELAARAEVVRAALA